ncbi:asparagine N-glycosylation enzyme membrane subunit Stt3 [Pseudoclavibacter chungangensis]|uniref:hypothetical protein n=1 Tax=Pseudoclavibacter chungangensis TaxID=587635 RepID=UPI00183DBF76|nr:hypothetical protein [Pseudoclavibacter chungangensis]NYJ65604.1 asparagine N-glycosylation enzyme membrane subunit Stt3 [Pseudoclavibacter chungangensis]
MTVLSPVAAIVCGVVLIAVIGIAYGGTFLLQVVGGGFAFTDFQKAFFRAGHAHAGVLVTLGLVVVLLLEAAGASGPWALLGYGVLASAILVPGGFFAAAGGHERTRPNRFVWLLWVGVAALVVGLVGAAVALIQVGVAGA